MIKILFTAVLGLMLTTSSYGAKATLEDWLDFELREQQNILLRVEEDSNDTDWFLNSMAVRLTVTLSVELPLIAKGNIKPEIEIFLNR